MQFGKNIFPPSWHEEFKNFSCNDHQIQQTTFAVDVLFSHCLSLWWIAPFPFHVVLLGVKLGLTNTCTLFLWSQILVQELHNNYPCFLVLCALVTLIFFSLFLRFLLFPRRMLSSNLPWIIRVDCEIYLKYHLKFKMPLRFVIGIDCIFITLLLILAALLQCGFIRR